MKPYRIEVILHADSDRDACRTMEEIAFLVANRLRRHTAERYLVFRSPGIGEREWQPVPEEAYCLPDPDTEAVCAVEVLRGNG